ncbi:MAG: DNA-formamidopyrimidine glycosylase family protein [Candidatus Hodarchaeales archaeon]|jgi:formamidopyrimidine-DNA glycosylase
MPELPEIEAILQHLISTLSNEVVTEVKTFQHTVIRNISKKEFEVLLQGATVDQFERIGKILRLSFSKSNLLIHLYIDHGLTGRVAWRSDSKKVLPSKTVFFIKFKNEKTMLYHDSRLHGAVWLFSNKNNEQRGHPHIIDNSGPDIFQVSESEFIQRMQRFNGEIKGILTNQKFVTGIGNAYADEILFEAKIHPFNKRPQLKEKEKSILFSACKKVLTNSVNQISHMLDDTQKLDNQRYWRQQIFKIHLKGKQPCPICGNSISTIKARRLTNFCRKCQIPKNRNFI